MARRKFIWPVSWDSVCKPKFLGGLGIKKAYAINQAMLAKTSWRMLQKDEGLWCVRYSKANILGILIYLMILIKKKPAVCSSTWTSVCYGASLLRNCLMWRVENGASVHFLTDYWSECGILSDHALDDILQWWMWICWSRTFELILVGI